MPKPQSATDSTPVDFLLFFGSFNPVHKGHIAIAQAALSKQIAKEIWFVLSPQNPFKAAEGLWPEAERKERLEKALEAYPAFRLCDAELQLPKPSYTIQTLDFLHQEYPMKVFGILMGQDNLSRLHLWKNYKEILSKCDIWVYPRNLPSAEEDNCGEPKADRASCPAVRQFPDKIHRLDGPLLDISSTQIRQQAEQGKDFSMLTP